MHTDTLAKALLAGLIATTLFAAPQDKSLAGQLRATYVPTVMEANHIKVAQPGTTLVVQVDGVQGNPILATGSKLAGPFQNTFEDGQVLVGGGGLKGRLHTVGGFAVPRTFAVGEKVYLTKLDIANNSIEFEVQSCGSCDPASADPAHKPYKAAVTFKFLKGFLPASDLRHVQDTINQVFTIAEADSTASDQGPQQGAPTGRRPATQQAGQQGAVAQGNEQPPVTQQKQEFKPLDEPVAPPSTTKLGLGQTSDQVIAILGQPDDRVDGVDSKKIFIYNAKHLKITFVKDKVTSVD